MKTEAVIWHCCLNTGAMHISYPADADEVLMDKLSGLIKAVRGRAEHRTSSLATADCEISMVQYGKCLVATVSSETGPPFVTGIAPRDAGGEAIWKILTETSYSGGAQIERPEGPWCATRRLSNDVPWTKQNEVLKKSLAWAWVESAK